MDSHALTNPLDVCPPERRHLLERFGEMLAEMNQRVNLVSRESIAERWVRHILHSLCLGLRRFPTGARVVDWGTGGGLPCIPLAIAFPDVEFVGIDAVGKKIMAVRAMVRRLGLDNVEMVQTRAEEWDGETNYSVSRATAPLSSLWAWHERGVGKGRRDLLPLDPDDSSALVCWPPGLVCLKGGDLREEIEHLKEDNPGTVVEVLPLAELVPISEFVGKQIVVVTADR
ncbi:MAG: RsmG family class I SAM-dependent methyltransferase [Rhodothermales bacterium]|nr:RsmG family class I SAM-dependent methyltransferase [Rhodothermales bacterium]